jgi:O-antigen/teichoic acid export membrane protein
MTNIHGLGLRKLASNAAITLSRQVVAGLLQLTTVVVIARVLGPEGNGQYTVALLLPTMLATLLNLGIGLANVYFLGAAKVDTATVFRAICRLSVIIVTAGLLSGAVCIIFFDNELFPDVPVVLLWVALAVFPFSLFQAFLSSIFQGLQKFNVFNLILLTQPIVTLIFVSILALFGITHIGYMLSAYFIGFVVTIGVGLAKLKTELSTQPSTPHRNGYIMEALNYGYKAYLSNILAFVNYKVDIFLVNFLISPTAAGLYVVAVQLVERLWLLSQAVSTVLLPRLSELSLDEQRRKKVTPIICRGVISVTLFSAVVLGIFSYPLVFILFGDDYVGALVPMLLLLPGIVALSGVRVLANDIAARGRPELNMYFSLIVVVANVSSNIVLIPMYGLPGAAVATSITYILHLILSMAVYNWLTDNCWYETIFLKVSDVQAIRSAVKR